MSFHATKVYNTFEGGAIISHDPATKKRIDNLKNFGFANEVTVVAPGINAKMNEFQAALGVLQLKYIDQAIALRKNHTRQYREMLQGVEGITCSNDIQGVDLCYPSFPILVDKDLFGTSRDDVYETLKRYNIFGRRYFYPLISQFPTYRGLESALPGKLPVAEKITKEIICLPLYPNLTREEITTIVEVLISVK
jgi:dTDP-4-amino-4,6-dideoxygalactose transaminase